MKESINKKKNNLIEKIDLPKDVLLNLPKITVVGKEEISIENHKGIEVFEKEFIKVKTNIGIVKVEGENFEILYIASETIVLSGKFKSISYEGISL
ncbi:sporulation protein YqfC [Clostridium sp. Ade.TY]|uniref:sporulation protein YqfC n=1 Tax=Clostridium sp. Ade.TY TaxID=1391647 RepID=UPI00040750A8|nr:sporulation protein YqfC [Clostridium sp. Ade.TY]